MLLPTVATFSIAGWIVLWSIGVKALDGFLLVLLFLLVAAGVKVILQHLSTRPE